MNICALMISTLAFLFVFAGSARAESLEERVTKLEQEVAEIRKQAAAGTQAPNTITAKPKSSGAIAVSISNKRYQAVDFRSGIMNDGIFWDLQLTSTLQKPIRSVKGTLIFSDLFGEEKIRVGWTVTESMKPGIAISEEGRGMSFNDFQPAHRWLKTTELKDMKVRFDVDQIIYEE